MRRHNDNRRRGLRFWLLTTVVVLLFILGGTAFAVNRVYQSNLAAISSSEDFQLVTVPLGATAKEIADDLEDKGLIRKSWAFQWYIRTQNVRDRLQAGTYAFRPNQSVQDIVGILTSGAVDTAKFTVLPNRTISEIEQDLINKGGFTPEATKAALEPSQYEAHPALSDKPAGASLEGYLYPETFQKVATTTPQEIIRASLDQMQEQLTPDLRRAFVEKGLTVHEAVTLASVVESEVGTAEERKKAAQVFLKRLGMGMRLQSDVTVHYGRSVENEGYNTYVHAGLPVGPISNVSASSLAAVAEPATTDYVFFVTGDDGVTYFSSTEEEHNQLIRQHCSKELCPAQ